MTTEIRTAILILLGGVLLAGAYVLFMRGGASAPAAVSHELKPEQAITHGHGLAVDVADSSKLYIATHHGLLVLVGEKDLFRVGASHDDYMGFSVHPQDPLTFFSSGHPMAGGNIGFQKSTDGGFSWTKISDAVNGPADFHAMSVSPVDPDLAYGWYRGELQRTSDGGSTWAVVNRDIIAVYLAADTKDADIVYAATPDGKGVLVSRDKGATWQSLSAALENGAVSTVAVSPGDNALLLAFSETLGGLGKSVDSGKTWQKIAEPFGGQTVLHMAFDPRNPLTVYALTHENALYKSADAGDTWKKIR